MRTFVQKPKAPQQATPTKATIPGRAHFGHIQEVSSILHLQRTIGNQAVQRMLQTHAEEPEARSTAAASPRFASCTPMRMSVLGATHARRQLSASIEGPSMTRPKCVR